MVHIERIEHFTEAAAVLLQEYYAAVGVVERHGWAEMVLLVADPCSAMWLAFVDTQLAGCVVLRHGVPTVDAGECKRLYVRPAFRGTGTADALMEHLETFAGVSHRAWVYLDTNEDFKASVKLYKRRGYVAVERYNTNPQANLFFRKQIRSADSSYRNTE